MRACAENRRGAGACDGGEVARRGWRWRAQGASLHSRRFTPLIQIIKHSYLRHHHTFVFRIMVCVGIGPCLTITLVWVHGRPSMVWGYGWGYATVPSLRAGCPRHFSPRATVSGCVGHTSRLPTPPGPLAHTTQAFTNEIPPTTLPRFLVPERT